MEVYSLGKKEKRSRRFLGSLSPSTEDIMLKRNSELVLS
jgi:hypothetical protein